ncbi:S41 family peptidase [Aquimarina sp. 2201CG5-10]|uniref:S41 family peptidase n=1 Tax=Aquimarina callyspongiae TaxID=3098150 RepID=UPI002AB4C274|nr:PDZ domain-containing protein [Aquimarina sp. 2201CG5-10]MDY8134040.1 PDZ domain-containing protein [Aquimarina sp. 2201CG5-10]
MKKFNSILTLLLLIVFCIPFQSYSIDPTDTRMLSQPAISSSHIAFIYAEDLWIANLDGAQPRRLTIDKGIEYSPVFSPDGKHIAFSAEYDGNVDVFIIPVQGGVPKRLTWHPMRDNVLGFSPDGKSVLFNSQRAIHTNRYAKLYEVSTEGSYPTELEIPNAWHASYSPDGNFMAYTPIRERFHQWKNYRGGTTANIWLFSFKDKSIVKIPQPQGGSNDVQPMWKGSDVFFLSDRNGEFNLFSYNTSTKSITQLTQFNDFPIVNASLDNDKIIFEQAGYLHIYSISQKTSSKLKVGIATDLLELRERFVKGNRHIRSADISPSGKRVVFDYRGEIITVPEDKGDPRNITSSPGNHEKYPAWSPDGKQIAYFSDASGEYQLHIKSQDGKGNVQKFKISGTGFYAFTSWSPDSKKISFSDNGRNLYLLDIASKKITKIDNDEYYVPGAFRNLFGDWSSDSNWIAYSKVIESNFEQVFLYSIKDSKSYPVSDGLSNASEPAFDPDGKYLYFFASTDAGPVVNWFDQSNQDMSLTNSIYLATLQKSTVSPFIKESDEEEIKEDNKDEGDSKKEENKEAKTLEIDINGIQNRIIDIPIKAGSYYGLNSAEGNKILYISFNNNDFEEPSVLHQYDLKERKDSDVMELDNYIISANGKKMLYNKRNTWGITETGKKPSNGKGVLKTGNIQVKINPAQEWENIFNEAWRINRDYFYDPGMHGADWNAMRKKYSQFLPHLSTRNDLNRLIQWMCSELSVGHHRLQGGGEQLNTPERIPGGLLGADYEIANNRYRFKKIYGGLNWNPNLRSPLTEPGIDVNEGDYLLAINERNINSNDNIYSFFENTADKIVELTVGSDPTGKNSRVIKVTPISSEYRLRNRDWVEGNLKKVHKATNGQVAYVYVPNTAGAGHEYFKRYFFPQADKKAIIIDERFNGGGQIADYYINLLLNPYQSHWNFRYGKDLKTPSASIQGPKVMIIDETAGSGGDMLPWMFRKFKVGQLVGKRTWGGLVGILGFPEFIDGASVTAPNVAIWTEDGFVVENVGVAPDIEVEQLPSEVIKGNDPQLEKAIEIVLKELKNNPPKKYTRPAYPKRARN